MMETINLPEDEPDVFYDCYEEEFDASLQSVAENFYQHVEDSIFILHSPSRSRFRSDHHRTYLRYGKGKRRLR